MRFIPDYRVCYKGRFFEADEEFEIDPADESEMRVHGEVVEDPTPSLVKESTPTEETVPVEKPKRGRPRRADRDKS